MSIANQVATLGSAGLLGSRQTLAGWVSTDKAPRFTGIHDIPLEASGITAAGTAQSFPVHARRSGEAFTNVVDDGVKTPHSSQMVASLQRELPGGWTSKQTTSVALAAARSRTWTTPCPSTWWILPLVWTTSLLRAC